MDGKDHTRFFFASESVGEGHPDKLCDQVSDAILDACLEVDPDAKLGMETASKSGMVVILGEMTLKNKELIDLEQIARKVCKEVGFTHEDIGLNADTMNVIINVTAQSPEIAKSVHEEKDEEELGAGDQGIMFGYATDESETLFPLTHLYASRMAEKLHDLRIHKYINNLFKINPTKANRITY